MVDFKKSETSTTNNYKIGNEEFDEFSLSPYAAGIHFFIKTNDISKSESNKTILEEQLYKKSFNTFGIILLIGFFVALLVSFFGIQHYASKNAELNIQNVYANKAYQQIVSLEQQKKDKETIINGIGLFSEKFLSFYVYDLSKSVPSEIILNEISVNPINKEIKNREKVEISAKKIEISGTTLSEEAFNFWLKNIKELNWLQKLIFRKSIESYPRNSIKSNKHIDWILNLKRKLGKHSDAKLIEKVIWALTLLEQLQVNGLNFTFKGGTALVLATEKPKRFSIDIDIITEHSEKEITAVLVKFKNKMGIISWPRMIAQNTKMQAALPAIEINRLFSLFGIGLQALQYLAYGIMLISGISIFIALFNRLKERKYEFALLRVSGASRLQLLTLVLFESLLLCVVGFILGTIVGRVALILISSTTDEQFKMAFNPLTIIWEKEGILFLVTIFVGIIAALIPAIKAYTLNISKTLANA